MYCELLQEDAHIYSARYTSKNKWITIKKKHTQLNAFMSCQINYNKNNENRWKIPFSKTHANLTFLTSKKKPSRLNCALTLLVTENNTNSTFGFFHIVNFKRLYFLLRCSIGAYSISLKSFWNIVSNTTSLASILYS